MPKANVPEKRASSNRNKNKGTAAAAAPRSQGRVDEEPRLDMVSHCVPHRPSYLQDQTVLGLDC